MRILTAAGRMLAAAALSLWAGAAAACGPGSACEIEGGVYHLALPEGPALGVVVFLHGYGGDGARVVINAGLMRAFTEAGLAVIAPTALPRREGTPNSWNATASPVRRDDIAFIRAAAADAARRFGLPGPPLLAAGFSGGGMMVWRIACDAPEAFSAYAPVAGLLWRPLPAECAGPVRMLHVHGWSDPVVPIEGRTVGGGLLTQGDLFAGLATMRRASDCAADAPDAYEIRDAYLIRRWTRCAPGAGLALAVHPGGHAIPKGWAALVLDWLGPPSRALDACLRSPSDGDTC